MYAVILLNIKNTRTFYHKLKVWCSFIHIIFSDKYMPVLYLSDDPALPSISYKNRNLLYRCFNQIFCPAFIDCSIHC